MKFLFVFILIYSSFISAKHQDNLNILINETIVISTHISSYWDIGKTAFEGAARVAIFAEKNLIPLIDLRSCHKCESPYTKEDQNYIEIDSQVGEVNITHNAKTVISLGGYPGACLYNTARDFVLNSKGQSIEKIIYVTDAIFGSTIFDKFLPLRILRNSSFYKLGNLEFAISKLKTKRAKKNFLKKLFRFGNLTQNDRDSFLSQFNFNIHYEGNSFLLNKYKGKVPTIDVVFMNTKELLESF